MGVMRFASTLLVSAAASGLLAFGCSSSTSSPPGGATGNGTGATTASVSAGETAVQTRGCPKCHGNDMAGSSAPLGSQPDGVKLYPPNLTPDQATGIGNWDDLQLQEAIVEGVDNEGLNLCPQMKHYKTMPDDEVAAIIAYLRSLPAVTKVIPGSICPPLKG